MALDIASATGEGRDTVLKGTFSFLDLLNGPTPLSPQNMGWSQDGEGGGENNPTAPENFTFLLCPPPPGSPSGYSGVTSSASPAAGDDNNGSRRNSNTFSDTTNSSSMSMPDLHVWGIGEESDRQECEERPLFAFKIPISLKTLKAGRPWE
ncbi:uncharacterized protein LOC110847226 isoform X2 [Folsomia candida]|uniref:uncharacterized protein LOC110847226 isoform X2 n=1 Tax=Folsomia candida TaxID=158441 RepID=UPI000B8F0CFC|nr:uncharacterized protein LOC110847226 isoform X2 [Folsomia candida]